MACENKVSRKPVNTALERVWVVGLSVLTARRALRNPGRFGPGEKVLMIGASGGVGSSMFWTSRGRPRAGMGQRAVVGVAVDVGAGLAVVGAGALVVDAVVGAGVGQALSDGVEVAVGQGVGVLNGLVRTGLVGAGEVFAGARGRGVVVGAGVLLSTGTGVSGGVAAVDGGGSIR